MADLERNIFRGVAGVSSIALAIAILGCGDVQPATVAIDKAPQPTVTPRPVFLETAEGFKLGFRGWHRFKDKLSLENISGSDLDFNNQGLDHLFEECGIREIPGSVRVQFFKSHIWPSPVEVTSGTRDIIVSIALGSLSEVDVNAHFATGLCVGSEMRGYYQGGKPLTREDIGQRVAQRVSSFEEAIRTGQIPRAITILTSS